MARMLAKSTRWHAGHECRSAGRGCTCPRRGDPPSPERQAACSAAPSGARHRGPRLEARHLMRPTGAHQDGAAPPDADVLVVPAAWAGPS